MIVFERIEYINKSKEVNTFINVVSANECKRTIQIHTCALFKLLYTLVLDEKNKWI